MTLTLELTPEQEIKLRAQADALALTPDGYLKKLAGLEETAAEQDAPEDTNSKIPPGQSLADALAGRTGRISSGKGHLRLSENAGQIFTEMMLEKRREGRL